MSFMNFEDGVGSEREYRVLYHAPDFIKFRPIISINNVDYTVFDISNHAVRFKANDISFMRFKVNDEIKKAKITFKRDSSTEKHSHDVSGKIHRMFKRQAILFVPDGALGDSIFSEQTHLQKQIGRERYIRLNTKPKEPGILLVGKGDLKPYADLIGSWTLSTPSVGYNVLGIARTREQVLRYIERDIKPHLILIDFDLEPEHFDSYSEKDLDGISIVEEIIKLGPIRIIYFTDNYPHEDKIKRANKNTQFYNILLKTCTPGELRKTIENAILTKHFCDIEKFVIGKERGLLRGELKSDINSLHIAQIKDPTFFSCINDTHIITSENYGLDSKQYCVNGYCFR